MAEIKPGHSPELTKESKEKEPKITVDFFFAPHRTTEDFSRLPEALKNADIYIPEALGWTEENEQAINEISQGSRKPTEPKSTAKGSEGYLLYNLKIPVVLVDIPREHPANEKRIFAETKIKEAFLDFMDGDFDHAIKNMREAMLDMALAIKDREDFIADQIKKELGTLTKKFPHLKNKTDIRVLINLGTLHTSLYKKLKPQLDSSKMILGQRTTVFGISDEILRRLIANPQETINDELYARAIIELGVLLPILSGITKDSIKLIWAVRKIAVKLTADQIRTFSEEIGLDKEDKTVRFQIKILKYLGIKLPTTEEEIDELINMRKK